MNCTCPKCHNEIELVLPEVTEKGSPTACTACKARLYVHKESFGGRAYRMTGEISCAHCGIPLGPESYCCHCGKPYPDLVVIAQGSKRAANPGAKTSPAEFRLPSLDLSLPKMTGSTSNKAAPSTAASKPRSSKSHLVAALVALLVIALGGVGFAGYKRHKAEKAYAQSFVRLTYSIQVGQERSLQAAMKLAADWQARGGTGAPPLADPRDNKDLKTLMTEIGKLQTKTGAPPEKYRQTHEVADKLLAAMQRTQSVALTPPSSLVALTDATAQSESNYQKTVREFKSALPDELMKDLLAASRRYQALQAILK